MFNKFLFSTFQKTIFVFSRGMIQGFKASVFVEDLTIPCCVQEVSGSNRGLDSSCSKVLV